MRHDRRHRRAPFFVRIAVGALLCAGLLPAQEITPLPTGQPLGKGLPAAGLDAVGLAEHLAEADFSSPSVPELLRALGKTRKPRWRSLYLEPVTQLPANRYQTALVLGMLLTDLQVAAEARDVQQVRNLVHDVEAAQKMLGLGELMRPRLGRLIALAEGEQWEAFRRETEAAQTEQAAFFDMQRDGDLSHLIALAAWMRALHLESVITADVAGDDVPMASFEEDLVAWAQAQMDPLSDETRSEKIVALVRKACEQLAKRASHAGPVSERRRREVLEMLNQVIQKIREP